MSEFRRYIVVFFCFLAGCANIPDSYAPPMQRKPLTGTEPSEFGHFVNMSDPNADAYIVHDISPAVESSTWRWTRKRPELRFFLTSIKNLDFATDFSIAESTLKDTGPVTISILINGKPFETLHYDTPGQRHFQKPVPESFLLAKTVNHVTMEIDKPWVSKDDGAVLGYILTRAGFTE